MESLNIHSMREGQRGKTQDSIQKIIIVLCNALCTSNVFNWQFYTRTSMLIYEPLHLLPNIFPRGIYVWCPSGFCTDPAFVTHWYAHRFTHRSVPTDPVFSFLSWSSRCWACLSTLPLCLSVFLLVVVSGPLVVIPYSSLPSMVAPVV